MYNTIKTNLSSALGLSKDALHIHFGLFIFLVLLLLFRRNPRSPVPWLGVLLFELANEVVDLLHDHGTFGSPDIAEAARDIANTMFWPTIAYVIIRFATSRRISKTNVSDQQ